MKKQIITIFAIILIIGLTTAAITVGNINNDRIIEKKHIDRIKNKTNVDKIEINISNPKCDNDVCFFYAEQEDVLNINFQIPTYYYDYGNCIRFENNVCVEYFRINYTEQEIREKADEYVEDRLISYSEALEKREKESQDKNIGGKITFKDKEK